MLPSYQRKVPGHSTTLPRTQIWLPESPLLYPVDQKAPGHDHSVSRLPVAYPAVRMMKRIFCCLRSVRLQTAQVGERTQSSRDFQGQVTGFGRERFLSSTRENVLLLSSTQPPTQPSWLSRCFLILYFVIDSFVADDAWL